MTTRACAANPPFATEEITGTISRTLAALPCADTVEGLLSDLKGHINELLPVVEGKDWARCGQVTMVGLMTDVVRDKLTHEPAGVAARCVYAQELARVCRGLLGLALTEPGDEQRHQAAR
ncbi:DUF6415 family natural product biosynthesis protein [Streptomyces morookaense]|uniref:Uncharacterized protein n=1 Tax=Streptomyces morookaense TaxID=1970 RepID=A0A7Y7B3W0_STRMO|nr:DUF6415 family natural product biosynthesis protein [Streptomyces morookaense]NVK78559.1 hypothetical protein [Streptomyces morookaense]GHF33315.1 hypothetical protein GCM10010359_40050 [Streptomyces morookaense]